MKKLPCLFVREFKPRANGRGMDADITSQMTPGLEEVVLEATPTRKWDGTACMVRDGQLYKRYDAKAGKQPPEGAIPCQEPDPVTGHWPHWVKVDPAKPEDKWHANAWAVSKELGKAWTDGTYELCGPHFSANPEQLATDEFFEHGKQTLTVQDRSFEGIRSYLATHYIEGIVFWHDGQPVCKIRRADFGFPWGSKR